MQAIAKGGGIKGRKMDFFVVTYGNFRFLLEELLGVSGVGPKKLESYGEAFLAVLRSE